MGEERLELQDIIDVVSRHRKLVQGFVVASVIIVLTLNLILPPVYESTVSVRIKSSGPNEGIGTSTPVAAGENLSRQQLTTYSEIFKSRTVIEEVIEKLYGGPGKRPTYEAIVGSVQTQPVRDSEILNVAVQADTPEEAQKRANTLLEVFMARVTNITRSEGKEGRIFIGERLAEAKRNLDLLEKELVDYKKTKQTVSVSDQTKNYLERQSQLKRMDIDNKILMYSANARLANATQQLSQQNPGFIADSPLIQQLKGKLADQEVELVGLRKNMTDNHPRVVALLASIEETKTKLNTEIIRVVKAEAPSTNPIHQGLVQNRIQASAEMAVAQAQQAALQRAEAENEKELKKLPEKEQGLARLTRDYMIAEETYVALSKKYEQARIDEVMRPTNVQIVDTASLPERPIKPRKVLNLALGMLAGLFVGLMSTFVIDYFRKTIDTSADVRRLLGARVIGSIPSRSLYSPAQRQSWWQQLFSRRGSGGRRRKS